LKTFEAPSNQHSGTSIHSVALMSSEHRSTEHRSTFLTILPSKIVLPLAASDHEVCFDHVVVNMVPFLEDITPVHIW
jgi:hypothetical protein